MRVTMQELAKPGFIKGLREDSSSILIKAVVERDWQEVLKLLRSTVKFNINVEVDQDRNTTLHFAVFYGQKEVVEKLIEAGAEVNKEDRSGNTPFHWAVLYGQKEIAELLANKMGLPIEIV